LDPPAAGGGISGTARDKNVFDPDSALARQVDARFDSDRNPGAKLTRSPVSHHRCLVDLEADAVTETVLEMLIVPGVPDQVPGRGVDVAHIRARLSCLDPGPLRGGHQLVDLPLPARGLAESDRAGHVRVIAAVHRAEVHRDQVTAAQRPVCRRVMGYGTVRAAGDDRVEGRTGRAELDHPPVKGRGERAFGETGADQAERIGQRLVTDPAGGRQEFELGRVLDHPEFLDRVAERDQRHPRRGPGQGGLPLDGHLVRLVGDSPHSPRGRLGS
jgi:hypothetical protein